MSEQQRTKGIRALALLVFILFAMPRLNIRIGPMPLYALDLVAFYLVLQTFSSTAASERGAYPFRSIIMVIAGFYIIGELSVVVYGGSIVFATYAAIQFFLAFWLIFAVPQLVRNLGDLELVLKAMALAMLVTASLMIMSSMAPTRFIASFIFSIPQLEPAANAASLRFGEGSTESAMRGNSLVGVSIVGSTFITVAWPLVSFLRTKRFHLTVFWSLVSGTAILIGPLGVIASYSRQAALCFIMIVVALLILPNGQIRRIMIRPVLLTVGLVAVVGVGSSLFFFDRYVNRVTEMVENPLEDERETARLLSYVTPFVHLSENPQFFIVGAGTTSLRHTQVGVDSMGDNHSLFGQGYYTHGMLSTLLFFFLLFSAYHYANWHRKRAGRLPPIARDWPRALYLAYLPIFPIAAFSPALASNVRVLYLYIVLLGLLSALRNSDLIASLASSQRRKAVVHEQRPSLVKEGSHA